MTKARAVTLAAFILLSLPGTAHAERHPTPREKTAIVRAARRAYEDHYFRVSISRIEVSTVERRWATASVALFHRKEPHTPAAQRIQETFYRTQRGWVAWFSVAMPDVEMPIGVERDFGFAGPAPLFGIKEKTVILVVFGLILLAVVVAIIWWLSSGDDDPPKPPVEVLVRYRR